MTLKFSDGIKVDTSGPLRSLRLSDGWYVIGEGMMTPMAGPEECKTFIDNYSKRTWAGMKPKIKDND